MRGFDRSWRVWLAAALALAGCGPAADDGPVIVSAIGAAPLLASAGRAAGDTPSRLLVDATAQGLVRFDAAGQVEPGLAERWIVIDGGRSYIFRLREARWSDGRAVDAAQVARLLGRMVGARATGPVAPYLTAVERVVAMTPRVIEVRLARPRPDLLKLFAQPELALVRPRPVAGSGPMRIAADARAPLLLPVVDPVAGDRDDEDVALPAGVRLIGERAARAIVRFAAGRAALVAGGGFAEWPLLDHVTLPARSIRIDPAVGLFGYAIVSRDGFLADPANRSAVAQAIDRTAIVAGFARGWEPVERLLPDGLDVDAPPQVPEWSVRTPAERRAHVRGLVGVWGRPIRLRIALPGGPGATRLFAATAGSLALVGIGAERVAIDAPADLALIDAVAPYDNARWYLATACRLCSAAAQDRLEAARTASTLGERAARTAEADAALNAEVAYIPIARPLRWSLVAPTLTLWTANARAWHPLNRLRDDTN